MIHMPEWAKREADQDEQRTDDLNEFRPPQAS